MRLNKEFILSSIQGASFLHASLPQGVSFSLDTRTLLPGEIYVALPGLKVDGHDFIKAALSKGAAGLMIEKSKQQCLKEIDAAVLKSLCVIAVPDTRTALITLATLWRAQFKCPVVAITGSVGKTSTKELLAKIIELQGKRCLVSRGNQNTALGISINMLRLTSEDEIAIFELGINKRDEMKELAKLVQPTYALITAIGHSHMEGLGSIVDIAAEKRAIFSTFKESNIGIVNGDQPLVASVAYGHPVVKFGLKTINQVQARKVQIGNNETTFILKLYNKKFSISLKNNHMGAVYNALAAASAAYLLGVPEEIIVTGMQIPLVVPGRFEQRHMKTQKGVIINDCYNASPESMKAALLAFERFETDASKVAVLGDMLELGVNSPFWHRQLGRFLRKVPSLQRVVLVGSLVQWTKKTIPAGVEITHVASWQEAAEALKTSSGQESLVLVKGSRSMGLDKLVDAICL